MFTRKLAVVMAAAVLTGCGVGHARMAADTVPLTQVSQATHTDVKASKEDGYRAYLLAYGKGNGCREDFDATYRGIVSLDDVPAKIQAEVDSADDELGDGSPAIVDYHDGSLIQVMPNHPMELVYVGPYTGACK